jgi:ABC-type multidrug transport system ATPase subunit
MLTGLIQPTSGNAIVGGFDITKEIDKAHLIMGVCPQFSILWGELTVKEHLLFYSRLKGFSIFIIYFHNLFII